MDYIHQILDFILKSFIHIWPFLLVSVPLAVIVNLSGASDYITRALSKKPIIAVLLATLIGAVSPFCSCGVIPVITSLLLGGVPLAPVMSFWIASPSMDPEVFFLSVATIGWKLSIWRLSATFLVSLFAGLITHYLWLKGFWGNDILKSAKRPDQVRNKYAPLAVTQMRFTNKRGLQLQNTTEQTCNCSSPVVQQSQYTRILHECVKAFIMVSKFMLLAFFLNAIIKFFVPQDLLTKYIAGDNPFSVIIAALIGIPFYTSNASALPLVSGFLSLGMNPGAVLTFLIAGPLTTLPAMAAVWGIVKPRVFILFLVFGLAGSVAAGYLYNMVY